MLQQTGLSLACGSLWRPQLNAGTLGGPMKLAAWGNAWTEFECDHRSSSFHRRLLLSPRRDRLKGRSGFATIVGFWPYLGRKFVAVYRFQNEIWLRVGRSRWNLDVENVDVTRHSNGKDCHVQIRHEALVQVAQTYRDPSTSWFARIDPTYDNIDLEADDIFLWLSRNVSDSAWRTRMRELWQDGA